MFRFVVAIVSVFILSACASTAEKTKSKKYSVAGSWACPAGKHKTKIGKTLEKPARKVMISIEEINGVEVLVMGSDNRKGPYAQTITAVDGNWRYGTTEKMGKLIAYKSKIKMQGQELLWESDVPSFVHEKLGKVPASKEKGKMWVDAQSGDLMSDSSFFPGTVDRCKKVQ